MCFFYGVAAVNLMPSGEVRGSYGFAHPPPLNRNTNSYLYALNERANQFTDLLSPLCCKNFPNSAGERSRR